MRVYGVAVAVRNILKCKIFHVLHDCDLLYYSRKYQGTVEWSSEVIPWLKMMTVTTDSEHCQLLDHIKSNQKSRN